MGAHRQSKGQAPFSDQSWSIWSLSRSNADVAEIPRADAWFELHTHDWDDSYRAWLRSQSIVYLPEIDPEYPGSRRYPKDEIVDEFGPYFFTSSIAWMQALAITQKPESIGIWGVEGKDDYGSQRAGILHFVQVARDRGIEVTVPAGCRLLDAPNHYGFTLNA